MKNNKTYIYLRDDTDTIIQLVSVLGHKKVKEHFDYDEQKMPHAFYLLGKNEIKIPVGSMVVVLNQNTIEVDFPDDTIKTFTIE